MMVEGGREGRREGGRGGREESVKFAKFIHPRIFNYLLEAKYTFVVLIIDSKGGQGVPEFENKNIQKLYFTFMKNVCFFKNS